jgi:hypothetical protein
MPLFWVGTGSRAKAKKRELYHCQDEAQICLANGQHVKPANGILSKTKCDSIMYMFCPPKLSSDMSYSKGPVHGSLQ